MDDSGESDFEFTIAGHSYQLIDTLSDIDNEQKREEAIRAHINSAENEAIPPCPEFPPNLQWFNASRPLFFADDLRGKVVVLDFFTYCCINCLHILPDLHRLEKTYSVSEGLVVIGIHSAKFEYEKVSDNILSAVLRYDITHPVVNDSETRLWNALDIQCWPSLVLLSPAGRPLLQLAGEGQMQLLSECIHVALSIYKDRGELNLKDDLPLRLSRLDLPSTPLCFPGKVTLDEAGKRLAISDTGHHRILVTDLNGVVLNIVGCGRDGHVNGKLSESRLNAPQGVAWKDNSLFIADTKNHVIRYANLDDDKVVTIVGTGVRGSDLIGGGKNTHQAISSPFDLILTSSVGSVDKDLLVIAMAGSHQIWLYFLSDGNWLKGQSFTRGTCVRFAGSGAEENRNNYYPHRAAFAQPSGITLHETATSRMLYVADSESSSVRQVSLTDGTVKALVGATREPQNLFAFGDVDGTGTTAKLQHPLGVAMEKKENPRLLVADSYNCKVKAVDVTTRQCVTLLGLTGREAALRTTRLNEPGGLDVHPRSGIVYIADTNNHCIRRFNPALGTLTEGSVDKDLLVIAMAGSHQIWLYFLSDGNWLKGQSFTRGTCVRFAGSGAEENRNNYYPHRAAFAQPSGITLHETATSRMLYVADSESSSVRQVSLTDGTVKALVGATREPQNLFAFGDVDGTGTTAKLQHPLGVAMEKKENPRLLVADSYNCKVKAVDVTTRQCVTLLGLTGREAALRTTRLNEPGGLDVHPRSGIVYIADTNNHCIRRFNPALGTLTEMLILGPEMVFRSGDEADSLQTGYQRLVSPGTETLSIRPVKMALDTTLQLVLYVVLGACFHPTEGAPLIWQISVEDKVVEAHMLQDVEDRRGTSDDYDNQPVFAIRAPAQSSAQPTVVRVECITYFCDEAGACRMKALLFEVPFLAVPEGTRTSQVLNYVIGTPQPGLLPL